MQAVSLSSSPPPAGAPANPQPQPTGRDDGGFEQVLRALSDRPSESSFDSVPTDADPPEAAAAQTAAEGEATTAPELVPPDQPAADTLGPEDQPEADMTIAAELFSLLVSGAAMAARLPPTAFAVTQAAERAMALLTSVDSQAGRPGVAAGPEPIVLSGPQLSPPVGADDIPEPIPPQGLSPIAGDLQALELSPPLQAGPGLRPGTEASMPARIIVPNPDPDLPTVPQQAGAVPAVFAFRIDDRSAASGHAASDPDPDGAAAAPPAPSAAVPMLDLDTGTPPLADLPEITVSGVPQGDAEILFGAPHALGQAAPASPLPGAGAPFVPAPLAATLTDLLLRRTDGPVELTLSPEELGRVRLSLSADGDGLLVTVQVERGDTLDLLRRNSDLLLQEIRAQGFSGATFSFSGWAGDRPEPGAHTGPDTSRPSLPSDPGSAAAPASPAATVTAGLDLRL